MVKPAKTEDIEIWTILLVKNSFFGYLRTSSTTKVVVLRTYISTTTGKTTNTVKSTNTVYVVNWLDDISIKNQCIIDEDIKAIVGFHYINLWKWLYKDNLWNLFYNPGSDLNTITDKWIINSKKVKTIDNTTIEINNKKFKKKHIWLK